MHPTTFVAFFAGLLPFVITQNIDPNSVDQDTKGLLTIIESFLALADAVLQINGVPIRKALALSSVSKFQEPPRHRHPTLVIQVPSHTLAFAATGSNPMRPNTPRLSPTMNVHKPLPIA